MIHQNLYITQIFPLYQLIRPNSIHRLKPRPFTHNAQLLLISPTTQRPQLPFLHPSIGADLSPTLARVSFQTQLSRLLSTERRNYLRRNIRKGLTWGAQCWLFASLLTVCLLGLNSERLERIYPTPPEWSLISRHRYRTARGNEIPKENLDGDVDYANQGARYRSLLGRLENPKKDGADLRPVSEDDRFYVKDVGKTVFDISAKSEAWREGYYGCMMGAGHAAERLDGWVHDTTRDIVFPAEVVIGPMNPRPKQIPPGLASAPQEENCVRAFEDPGTYYWKILETRTFSTRQRLQAALAYADWLDFKNSPSAAKEMYDLGLQIAVKGLPPGAGDVVDVQSGVIHDAAEHLSSNILLATTAMGRHQAHANNLSAALPIFLSILRARRRLPPGPPSQKETSAPPPAPNLRATIRSFLVTPPYPPIQSSGDEPQLRTSASVCEEAGIMVHIGEIFFASSLTATKPAPPNPPPSSVLSKAASFFFSSSPPRAANPHKSGLSWTRDAIHLAETTLLSTPSTDTEARTKCAECLDAGMENWSKMVGRMLKEARAARMTMASWPQTSANEGKGQEGGNWVWKGAGVSGVGGGSGSGSGSGSGRGGGGERGRGEGGSNINEAEEEEWIQEAMLVQTETARLARVFVEEGIEQESRGGGQREWGLMNR